MKTYYYIARAKRRNAKEFYVGDGIRTETFEGQSVGEIKKEIARNYNTSAKRVTLHFRPEDQR